MPIKLVHPDSPLKRTESGTAKMRARSSDISPKLRSVLFLIDGKHNFRELLDRAGSLRDLLESQINQLLELELIETERETEQSAGQQGPIDDPEATTPVARHHARKAQDLPPLVAAKMQLLIRLESIACDDVDLLGAELLEAKTLKELAQISKAIAAKLVTAAGEVPSKLFWADAKKVLTAWRDISSTSQMEAFKPEPGGSR